MLSFGTLRLQATFDESLLIRPAFHPAAPHCNNERVSGTDAQQAKAELVLFNSYLSDLE